MWSIHSVPARDVAAPHFVAFSVIHNGLLDLVELLGELLVLIKAPASQADVHSRIRSAALVGQNGTSDVAVAVERTLDFNHCHIKILREKAVIKFADAFVCLKLSNNPDIPQTKQIFGFEMRFPPPASDRLCSVRRARIMIQALL